MGYIEHLIRSIFRREASRKATEVVMNSMDNKEAGRGSSPQQAESETEVEEKKVENS